MKFFLWFPHKPVSHLASSRSRFSFSVSWSYTQLIQECSSSPSPFLLVRSILGPLHHGGCHPQPRSVFAEVWFILTQFWCLSLHSGHFCSRYLRSYNGVFSLRDPSSMWSQPRACFLSAFLYPSRVFLSISQCHALCLPSESLASDPILWISYSLTAPIPQGHHDYPNLFEKREWEGTARTPYLNPNPICPLFFNGQTPLLPPVSSSISSPPSIQWSFWSFFVLEKNYFLLHIVSFPTLFLV